MRNKCINCKWFQFVKGSNNKCYCNAGNIVTFDYKDRIFEWKAPSSGRTLKHPLRVLSILKGCKLYESVVGD